MDACTWSYDLAHIARVWRACEAHLDRVREDQVLPWFELSYEALCRDPRLWTERLLEFCGLPWDDACLEFHGLARSVETSSAGQVHQPVYQNSVGRWRAYAPWLGPLLELASAPAGA
jgi:Sulfotransferase family